MFGICPHLEPTQRGQAWVQKTWNLGTGFQGNQGSGGKFLVFSYIKVIPLWEIFKISK